MVMMILVALATLTIVTLVVLFVTGWSRMLTALPSPRYASKDFLPDDVKAIRWGLGEAQALVVTRGIQGRGTPSVIFVPGFAEDYRYGLLGLSEWMSQNSCFRLTVLLKRGYVSPFFEQDIHLQAFPGHLGPGGEVFTIEEDAAVVRALIENDPSDHIVLWGHSQGGAVVQDAVTLRSGDHQFSLRRPLLDRVRGLVLEGSVLPDSGFSFLVGLPKFKSWVIPGLNFIPIGHFLDDFLIYRARKTLRTLGRSDLEQRLSCLDRCLYVFQKPLIALDNGWSIKTFVKERGRVEVLKELHKENRLFGLFPSKNDLILDTQENLRVMRESCQLSKDYVGLEGPIMVLDQTHFVSLERPELAADLLHRIADFSTDLARITSPKTIKVPA
jgi:pimeloyl-ACP methyl ester carboxylesterase